MRTMRLLTGSLGLTLVLVWMLVPRLATAQIASLPHADTSRGNYFGAAVAIDGSRILVGAHGETSCDVNGGAAYVFERQSPAGLWKKTARLVPTDCRRDLSFGRAVALSGDFALIASTSEFFATVRSNAVYVFERDSAGVWEQAERLVLKSEEEEGPAGAAVDLDGDRALITTWGDPARSRHHGSAYVFERDSGEWKQAARITGGRRAGVFGGGGALAGDAMIVTGSTYFRNRPGFAYIFGLRPDGSWQQTQQIADLDDFFISVDMQERHLIIGESRDGPGKSGVAAIHVRDSTGFWKQSAMLKPPAPYRDGSFGTEVAIAADRALVVGYDEQLRLNYNVHRVVYVFGLEAETWTYRSIIDLGEAAFGTALDLHGRVAVIGAASGDVPGAAYVVHLH